MATRTIRRNDLVGLTSISFIRPQRISVVVSGTKPSTRLYAFFDGVSVDRYITPSGGSIGGAIITTSGGSFVGTFDIPPATFNTGNRVLRLQDSPVFDDMVIVGNTIGSAVATFTAEGLKQTFQETITNITELVIRLENNIIDPPPPPPPSGDPLAQSFFTYGVKGGCFVTKIDIYFQSKDASLPVILQLRHMENGYPSSKVVSRYSTATLQSASVITSSNASAKTTFTFSRPIYLEENKDYCFVLMANSNKYNVWTSKFGALSVETRKTIFEQPYIGSLFKSENNITWSAEQTEDIKFTIYKSSFVVGGRDVTFNAVAPPMLMMGDDMSVTSGSSVVTTKFKVQHGHKTGDKIAFAGLAGSTYRGITAATFSNPIGYSVNVIDEYSLTFNVGTNATSTGTLASSGTLNAVEVDSFGSGYASPVISFVGGGGSGAAASAVVVGGKIISVSVTNPGSGYTSTPTLTLTDASGSGAVLTPISEAIFVTTINRRFQNLIPLVQVLQPPETRLINTIQTSSEDYTVGQHEIHAVNLISSAKKDAVLVSPITESISFGSNNSTQMILRMESDNANVSPMIDMGETPRLRCHNFVINDSSNAASELTPNSGTSYSRYVSKITTLETTSKDVRVFVNGASLPNSSFDVFIRTSLSSNSVGHKTGSWNKLVCDVTRNKSITWEDYKDYSFYVDPLNLLSPFDVYDIKIVLYSTIKHLFPKIANYRTIILAT